MTGDDVTYALRVRSAGEPSMANWIINDVLDHTPEMLWRDGPSVEGRAKAWSRLVSSCVEVDRVEIAAFADARIVGFCVLVEDDDANVGPVISFLWNYVTPQYRGRVGQHFYRKARALAMDLGIPILAYTQRVGEGEYQLKYRRIANGQSR